MTSTPVTTAKGYRRRRSSISVHELQELVQVAVEQLVGAGRDYPLPDVEPVQDGDAAALGRAGGDRDGADRVAVAEDAPGAPVARDHRGLRDPGRRPRLAAHGDL